MQNEDKTPTILPPPTDPPVAVEIPNGPSKPKPRGFAAMDSSLVRDIASKGGKAAHAAGTAHEFTQDEAREAGRKGGKATIANRMRRAREKA